MDAQFWIYIVIGIIYLVSTLLKKKDQPAPEVPESERTERRRPVTSQAPSTEGPRQLTFEELLREITEGKQAQKRQPEAQTVPKYEPETVPEYEPYEKDPGEEARSLEDVDFNEADSAKRWKPYEEIPAHSFERKSLEETLYLEKSEIKFGKFEAFEKKDRRRLLDDYIRIIRDPQSLKQAVVMSEILKRKF